LLLSLEVGAPFPDKIDIAEGAILSRWRQVTDFALPAELRPPPWPDAPSGARISAALQAWARACPRPLVLFLDEIDALSGEVLVTVLRQLRDGYGNRPEHFPWRGKRWTCWSRTGQGPSPPSTSSRPRKCSSSAATPIWIPWPSACASRASGASSSPC
jgi:hypothetical protein